MASASSVVFAGIAPHPPIMVPEVGREAIAEVRASIDAMSDLTARVIRSGAETVVMISPHAPLESDTFVAYDGPQLHGDFAMFRAPTATVDAELDDQLLNEITRSAAEDNLATLRLKGFDLDHGTAVPLYFLQRNGWNGRVIALGYSFLSNEDHLRFGKRIKQAVDKVGRPVAFIASGDLSHRLKPGAPAGYNPEAHLFDEEVVDSIRSGTTSRIVNMDQELRRMAGECGYRSMLVVLGLADGIESACEVISYEAPFGVGYLVAQLVSRSVGVATGSSDASAESADAGSAVAGSADILSATVAASSAGVRGPQRGSPAGVLDSSAPIVAESAKSGSADSLSANAGSADILSAIAAGAGVSPAKSVPPASAGGSIDSVTTNRSVPPASAGGSDDSAWSEPPAVAGGPTKSAASAGGPLPGIDLPALARQVIETFVTEGKIIDTPQNLSELLQARVACFVSIKTQDGDLRGCIGTFEPAKNTLAEELITNAISAATRDPRFPPVREDELPVLKYSVDVLSPPEPATIDDLDPKLFGVIVEDQNGIHRGLLLPNLEGIDTVTKQVEIASRKAGIAPGTPVILFRFRAERYSE